MLTARSGLLTGLALGLACCLAIGIVHADVKYRLYCANGKLEVDTRTPEQMQRARGQVCLLGEFDTRAQAEAAADRRGGSGAPCTCP
ncbi:hypothetical protein [Chloracidobacterium aggregatum]|uniref:Uncharacterized protein n=1 Tax=Chloracidobacterium sp. N TaxID=2821540 RepID=A0ABX8B126_9BACT|nr:hypothetical protein [Chloracidobacterium aggregatum]QUV85412.1 hypothetical protein J8C03_03810 [Chloracidobacterium sp. 2]QUV88186.1 hypothetical protein J8C07_02320 [Chloracidobacterium sp. S]QUV94292.1 hypothetical protein J8C05_02255 [Chloracidobacterium sp. N]QUV97493.1 hypothetical protein J8C00_03320 [Chloracidobacterium sp. E]